jgi:hypothetical protein
MITAFYNDFLMIFSSSIGLCVDNKVDNDNGICVTDTVFEPAPIEISGNSKQFHYIRYILNNVFCFYLKLIEYSYLDD